MPIYQVGEHELIKEESSLIVDEETIIEGRLYLSDKRFIFEKYGRKSFLRASAGQTMIDLNLYDITNVYTAVPKLRVFTRKTLTVEYLRDSETQSLKFAVKDPEEWESNIRKFASDLKKLHEDDQRRLDEDRHRKDVEMARAKAGMTNVGVMHVHPEGRKGKTETVIDAEGSESSFPQKAPPSDLAEYDGNCRECGVPLPLGAKFCPTCGSKTSKR